MSIHYRRASVNPLRWSSEHNWHSTAIAGLSSCAAASPGCKRSDIVGRVYFSPPPSGGRLSAFEQLPGSRQHDPPARVPRRGQYNAFQL
jgi:hypothetical protein